MLKFVCFVTLLLCACGSKKEGGGDDACATARKSIAGSWDSWKAKINESQPQQDEVRLAWSAADSAVTDATLAWRGTGDATAGQEKGIAGAKAYLAATEKNVEVMKQLQKLAEENADKGTGDPALAEKIANTKKIVETEVKDAEWLKTSIAKLETEGAAALKACAAK